MLGANSMLGGNGDNGGGGDIWSTGAFSFESPLKDLLDSGDYSLEQLLAEDELLQELRSYHEQLTQYFAKPESVKKLVEYVIMMPTQEGNLAATAATKTTITTANSSSAAAAAATSSSNTRPTTTTMEGVEVEKEQQDDGTTTTALAINNHNNNDDDDVDDDNEDDPNHTASPVAADTAGEGNSTTTTEDTESEVVEAAAIATESTTTTTPPPHRVLLQRQQRHFEDDNNKESAIADKNNQEESSEQQQQQNPDKIVVDPASLKHVRFPYMACEIICCEIPEILQTLVEGKVSRKQRRTSPQQSQQQPQEAPASGADEGPVVMVVSDDDDDEQGEVEEETDEISILDLLFSLLYDTKIGDLDDYRAGYFDKVLTVLFRKKPQEMTLYINNSGHRLMESMMGHLYSHSIMQIAQRLLLPRRPSPMMEEQEQQQQQEQQPQDEEEDIISAGGNNNEQAPEMISGGGGGDEIVAGENGGDDDGGGGVIMCDWSESPEILDILLDTLMAKQPGNNKVGTTPNTIDEEQLLDLSLNASEVLITIIQNSMLSSPTMLSLTSSETILRIINAATDCSGENENNYFSPHESLLTSAMNVLESLVLQLGGYGAVGTMSLLPEEELALQRQEEEDMAQRQRDAQMAMEQQEQEMMENESNNNAIMDDDGQQQQQSLDDEDAEEEDDVALAAALSAASKALIGTEGTNSVPDDNNGEGEDDDEEPLIADLSSMLEHLPLLLERLSYLLRHPSTKQWTSPMQFSQTVPQQMLGNSRLRIVRVLESLVLLGDPDIDSKLVQSNCLEICLDFFWEFQWCSMLHQSVANLLVHVFEGQNTRFEMQEYFLVKCNLLGRLMDSFVDDDPTHHIHGSAGNDLAPASSGARIEDVVTNLQDVTMSKEGVSSVESEKGSSSDDPLPVSEDDVDAAMETENKDDLGGLAAEGSGVSSPNIEQISTEAVRFESRDVSTVGDINAAPPSQTFRYGYMGHVIIICQALVHAYTNDPQEHDMEVEEEEGAEITSGAAKENGYVTEEGEVVTCESGDAGGADPSNEEGPVAEAEPVCPKDDFGEPLLLFEIVHTHALAERWHEFVDTTLSTETAVQSTPLGGFSMQMPGMDPMHSHRPGLADEGYMMGDDGEGPPAPPRGMLGGGDAIDMDENDLDVAASMMAGLSLGRTVAGEDDDSNSGSINSGDSERSYNSGETASERSGYAFDDPLGKTGGLGIELGKLTQYKAGSAAPGGSAGSKGDDDDDGSHSSSDEEPESQQTSDTDVPVMDLFAGNFDYGQENVSEETPASGFADFANFDAAPTNDGADDFGPFTSSDESEEIQKKSSDIDEIFGAGDHADLLASDEPQETNKTSDIDEIFGTGDHADLLVNDEPQDTDKSANIDETLGAGDKADLVEKNKVAVVEPVNPFDDAVVGTEAAENAAAASGEGVGTDAYMTSLIEAAGKVQSTEDTSPPDGLDVVVSAPSDELMADAIARVENKKETSKDGQVVDIA